MRDVTPPGLSERYLRALIEAEGGSISVERFMQEALYHPQFGYYARRVGTVGKGGDFSTSATLHPALGRAVAAWATAHRVEILRRGEWHLIELGGGTGQLAAEIWKSIPWWPRRGLRYHVVEISEGLRVAQCERLRRVGSRVRWHVDVGSALAAAGGCALVISNEFADAFPCVQLRRGPEDGRWQEVRVCWPENAAVPNEMLADWDGPLPEFEAVVGQRVELHLTYRRWLEDAASRWKNGRMLTIDYGDVPPGLYYRRPHGTLRGYCRHQRIVGVEVYQRFGQQDLTADVNFADLQRWGEAAGFFNELLSTQAEFLRQWLPAVTLKRMETDPVFAALANPEGAGGAFKALEQTRRKL